MSRVWIIAIFSEARFRVVAVGSSEEEAKKIAKALTSLGRPLIWEAEERVTE